MNYGNFNVIQNVVKHAQKLHNLPRIWIALAGIKNATAKSFESVSLQKFSPGFTIAVLDMPLRTTKAVRQMAGLDGPNVQMIANVTSKVKTCINFTLPPHLISGAAEEKFTY